MYTHTGSTPGRTIPVKRERQPAARARRTPTSFLQRAFREAIPDHRSTAARHGDIGTLIEKWKWKKVAPLETVRSEEHAYGAIILGNKYIRSIRERERETETEKGGRRKDDERFSDFHLNYASRQLFFTLAADYYLISNVAFDRRGIMIARSYVIRILFTIGQCRFLLLNARGIYSSRWIWDAFYYKTIRRDYVRINYGTVRRSDAIEESINLPCPRDRETRIGDSVNDERPR